MRAAACGAASILVTLAPLALEEVTVLVDDFGHARPAGDADGRSGRAGRDRGAHAGAGPVAGFTSS